MIEIIVRPQKQRNALAGQQPVRQHLRQHAAGPHLLLARANDKHAALPGGAGRQSDAVAPDLRREIAIRLAALRAGQHRIALQPGGVHPVELRHHQRLVHLRPFGERPAAETLKIGALAQHPAGKALKLPGLMRLQRRTIAKAQAPGAEIVPKGHERDHRSPSWHSKMLTCPPAHSWLSRSSVRVYAAASSITRLARREGPRSVW